MQWAILLVMTATAALTGCADRNIYPGEPLPRDRVAFVEAARALDASADIAIDGAKTGSLAQYYLQPGTRSWLPGKPTKGAAVLPGRHSLTARIARYGWFGAADTHCATLMFDAEAGRRYRLQWDDDAVALHDLANESVVANAELGRCTAAG
ncbi:MAG: hypothetical protein WD767_08980 [Alphaproteobacteria bacterium]